MAKAEWRIREAAGHGAQIVCLQELFRSQYFCLEEKAELFDLAEPVPAPPRSPFRAWRVSWPSSSSARFSSAGPRACTTIPRVVIDADGSLAGAYRKMHVPEDPPYYEKFYFTPGDLGFRCFDTRYARVAPLVCGTSGFRRPRAWSRWRGRR